MKLKKLYVKFSIVFTGAALLFAIINLVVYWMNTPYKKRIVFDNLYTFHQLVRVKPKLAKKIHPGMSENEMFKLYSEVPNNVSHPVLEFMNAPVKNSIYEVGFENCRYSPKINNRNIKKSINGSTWVFGGSTMFGYGVRSEHTIANYLQQIDNKTNYINFGILGFSQNQEIEKLILLLKKGYRPKKVIFLDGLNDLTQLVTSNFHPAETPARPYLAYNLAFAPSSLKQSAKNSLYGIPLIEYMLQIKANNELKKQKVPINEDLYVRNSIYHENPYLHLQKNLLKDHKIGHDLENKVKTYYKSNLELIDHLAKGYNFEYYVFYQPIGVLYAKNPFIKNQKQYKKSFMFYKQLKFLNQTMKKNIANKTISNMIDISDLDKEIDYPYLDLTHYTAKMNKRIAQEMLKYCNSKKELQ